MIVFVLYVLHSGCRIVLNLVETKLGVESPIRNLWQ